MAIRVLIPHVLAGLLGTDLEGGAVVKVDADLAAQAIALDAAEEVKARWFGGTPKGDPVAPDAPTPPGSDMYAGSQRRGRLGRGRSRAPWRLGAPWGRGGPSTSRRCGRPIPFVNVRLELPRRDERGQVAPAPSRQPRSYVVDRSVAWTVTSSP